MYEAGSVESYAATMRKARDLGVEYFQSSIDQFLKTLSFDVVAKKLVEDIGRLDNSITQRDSCFVNNRF